jgi:iron complex outermembrane receptor protein
MIAPTFSYKLNDRLTVLLDVEFSNYKATSPFRLAPSTSGKAHSIQDLGINYNLSFASNSVSYTTRQLNVFGQINYKMDDNWTSQTIFSRTQSSTNGYTVQLTGLTDSTLRQSVTQQDFPYYGTDIQQNFIGDFQLGGLRNRLVAGLDFFHLSSFRTDASVNMPALNFKKPGAAYTSFNGDKIASLFATATFQAIQPNREYTYSAYVSDVVNVTDRLLVMASLRLDRYDSKGTYYSYYDSTAGAFTQTALSPKLGLVYQLIKDRVSLFANYMNGFQNVNGSDYGGNTFKPQQANQSEGGLKFDIWQHKLNATFTYYNISVTNTTRDDTAHAGYSIQDGTQLSKGFEGELIANPLPGFNIVAGYTYNNSRYDKANKSIQGLRPSTAGPGKMANVWLSYRLTKGRGKGLGLGLGANYGSASTQSNTSTFVFTIPSYTVLDATLFYDQPSFRIGIKVDNLTNEKYWSYRLAPQNPTRVTANIAVKF